MNSIKILKPKYNDKITGSRQQSGVSFQQSVVSNQHSAVTDKKMLIADG